MATINNFQGDEPPRSTAWSKPSWQQWNVSQNKTMIWRNSYVKGTQDTTFKRKTKKTVPNGGTKRGQRAVTHQANQSGKTWAFYLSWIWPPHLLSWRCRWWRNGGYHERPQRTSVQRSWRLSKQNRLTVHYLRQLLSPATEISHATDWKLQRGQWPPRSPRDFQNPDAPLRSTRRDHM